MADLQTLYQTKIYRAWSNMKNRCNNRNYEWYKNYGWRWITYDKKWEIFEHFYNDMKEWHKDNLTLERINNNWNYCKANCRWDTKQAQANNRSSSTSVTYKWKTRTLAEWSRVLWIKYSTLRQRFYTYKWSIDKCLTYNS